MKTAEELAALFTGKAIVRDEKGEAMGFGMREAELLNAQGFSKKELRDLVKTGTLEKIQCRSVHGTGPIANVYVLSVKSKEQVEVKKGDSE